MATLTRGCSMIEMMVKIEHIELERTMGESDRTDVVTITGGDRDGS